MQTYRFYFLNMASAIDAATAVFTCETDAAARQRSEELFRLNGARSSGFELWNGDRRVHRHLKIVGKQ